MDQNQRFDRLLADMAEANHKQLRYARVQCFFSIVAAVCCVIILVVACLAIPRLQLIAQQTEVVLSNLETVTASLAEVDLDEMVQNVNSLVLSSESGIREALQKLNDLDFETLNKAIEDLADIVEPIAKFFNSFQK